MLEALSQSIVTSTGVLYHLSFDVRNNANGANDFGVSFGNTVVLPSIALASGGTFSHYTFDVVASTGSSNLTFSAFNNPGTTILDNISVTRNISSVPGPLAALPFAFMAVKRRRPKA